MRTFWFMFKHIVVELLPSLRTDMTTTWTFHGAELAIADWAFPPNMKLLEFVELNANGCVADEWHAVTAPKPPTSTSAVANINMQLTINSKELEEATISPIMYNTGTVYDRMQGFANFVKILWQASSQFLSWINTFVKQIMQLWVVNAGDTGQRMYTKYVVSTPSLSLVHICLNLV